MYHVSQRIIQIHALSQIHSVVDLMKWLVPWRVRSWLRDSLAFTTGAGGVDVTAVRTSIMTQLGPVRTQMHFLSTYAHRRFWASLAVREDCLAGRTGGHILTLDGSAWIMMDLSGFYIVVTWQLFLHDVLDPNPHHSDWALLFRERDINLGLCSSTFEKLSAEVRTEF